MTERVMFKASRPFTAHVQGEGMVVFNGEKKDDKGKVVREATTAELPLKLATEYAERGFGEMTGKGAKKVKKLTAADRREARLAARAERRAKVRADGALGGGEGEGEQFLETDRLRDARDEADAQPGDGKDKVRADGNGNQVDTTAGPQSDANQAEDEDGEGEGEATPARARTARNPRPRGARSAGNATAENGGQTETASDAPTD